MYKLSWSEVLVPTLSLLLVAELEKSSNALRLAEGIISHATITLIILNNTSSRAGLPLRVNKHSYSVRTLFWKEWLFAILLHFCVIL